MHLKILLLSRGLKLSNIYAGCGVSAFHFSVEQIPQQLSDIELIQISAFFCLQLPGITVFHGWKAMGV